MILTVTLNPSIDYIYRGDTFKLGETNRFSTPKKMLGGKGINAGRVLNKLGSEVIMTGLIGENSRDIFKHILLDEHIDISNFNYIQGNNRNAITIMHDNNIQTEIVEEGPVITKENEEEIIKKISELIQQNNIKTICLSGSVNTTNHSLYLELLDTIDCLNIDGMKILLDISGDQLLNALNYATVKPFAIKPNIIEFSELVGKKIDNKKALLHYLSHLDNITIINGIELVIISCGSEGAVIINNDRILDVDIPTVDVLNPTGSGDSTVAGIAYSIDQGFNLEKTIKTGMACGISNSMNLGVGEINLSQVDKLMTSIKVKKTE